MIVFDGNSMFEKYSATCPRCIEIKKQQQVQFSGATVNPDSLPSHAWCRRCLQHKRIIEETDGRKSNPEASFVDILTFFESVAAYNERSEGRNENEG